MSPWLWLLLSLISSIVAAVVSSRLTVKAALKSKWWEKKEQAYADVINALYAGLRYYEEEEDHIGNPEEPDTDRLWKKAQKEFETLQRATSIGEFYICSGASKVLREFIYRNKPIYDGSNKDECVKEAVVAYTATLDKIRKMALKDLGIK